MASLAVFMFLGWLDFQSGIAGLKTELHEKSKVAARRVSAELLLQENGAVDSVLQMLESELELGMLSLTDDPECEVKDDFCSRVLLSDVLVIRQIPQISPVRYVVLSEGIQPYINFLNLSFLAWSTLPVFFLIAAGLFVQWIFLKRKIIEPVSALVGVGNAHFSLKDEWPVEVKKIGSDLKASFEAREQAVFALLAKGVIHDIKTFMHSLLIATDMIDETADELKRGQRLENLYKASKSNLPKMKRIIELTLDGSRDIPINEAMCDLIKTVNGAASVNKDYAKEKAVTIRCTGPKSLFVTHDPVQLERAIANLIRNGIEVFSGDENNDSGHKEVLVSVSEDDQNSVKVSVEDSGRGYSRNAGNFMPVRSKKAHGAGLGLYITNKIIQGHHGSLVVAKSTILGGARFSVFLPRRGD